MTRDGTDGTANFTGKSVIADTSARSARARAFSLPDKGYPRECRNRVDHLLAPLGAYAWLTEEEQLLLNSGIPKRIHSSKI